MRFKYRIPVTLAYLGVVFNTAAYAGVEGNQFDVRVLVPSTGPPTQDCFAFNTGGAFCTASGQSGTWTESDMGLFGFWSSNTADADLAGFQLVSTLIVGVGETTSGLRVAAVGFAGGDCACGGGSTARVSAPEVPAPDDIGDWRRSPAQR